MENITGFTREQSLAFLRAYTDAPLDLLSWERYPICTFIMLRYLERRTKIMLDDERKAIQKNIWQFVAHWYDVLGYGLPVDADRTTKLFAEFDGQPLWRKVEARREFLERILRDIDKGATIHVDNSRTKSLFSFMNK